MAVYRDVPYAGMNFVVDIAGIDPDGTRGGVSEVILPAGRIATDKYRNGNESANSTTKLPHQVNYDNLVLKRGLIGALNWYEWWDRVRKGEQNTRVDMSVKLLSEDRTTTVMEWQFQHAVPVAYQVSPLNAHDPEILIETLVLSFKDFFVE